MNNILTILEQQQFIFLHDPIQSQLVINSFENAYPGLHQVLYEKGLNATDYARSINAKIYLINYYLNLPGSFHFTSNIIPPNVLYDFYINKINSTIPITENFQIKKIITNGIVNEYQINNQLAKYIINKHNSYLVYDISSLHKTIQTEKIQRIIDIVNNINENHLKNILFVENNFFKNPEIFNKLELLKKIGKF